MCGVGGWLACGAGGGDQEGGCGVMMEAIGALVDEGWGRTETEAGEVMHEIMGAGREGAEGARATEAQFGAFVTALRLKGETVDEITGMARAMRSYALHVDVDVQPLLDTCATGGSRQKKFNPSTPTAFAPTAPRP